MHSVNEGKRGEAAPRLLSGRGLSYWSDGKEERIIYVTPGYQMVALDAKTGQLVPGFGTNGVVDLKTGLDQEGLDLTTAEIGLHAAPIISKDIIVIGAAHREGGFPKSKTNVKGYIRGFDVRTGKRVWVFHTIPMKGEKGFETWDPDAAQYTGNAGVWAQMSADEELGIVYMPVELPTGDYYGGHRHGAAKGPEANLYSESVVALDIKTGQKKWHYQLVHHGIWDHDIPCAPILMDLVVDGKPVKVVAQPTKQNWLYVFDRVTGKPVWPIEERAVEKGDVPGEWYSPTQPFVTKPPAYERQGVTIDDLIDYTPELRAEAAKLVSQYKIGPIFTPPSVSKWEGPRGTLMLPDVTGGANWQGGSFDPETKRFYIFTNVTITTLGLTPPNEGQSDMLFGRGVARNPNPPPAPAPGAAPAAGGGGGGGLNVRGLPLVKPPYATITAIDMNKGEQLWRIAHGDTADNVKNNPALKGLTIPRTGRQGRIGVLTTKTDLREALEHQLNLVGRNPCALVVDRTLQLACGRLATKSNAAAARAELDGVRDQVTKHLKQPRVIESREHRATLFDVQPYALCRRGWPEFIGHFRQQYGNVAGGRHDGQLAGVDARHVHQVTDQARRARRMTLNARNFSAHPPRLFIVTHGLR